MIKWDKALVLYVRFITIKGENNMQANMADFLNGVLQNNRYFYIPVYQRNYSWKEEQCEQLLSDIMSIYDGKYKDHFLGSIVWKSDNGNSNMISIIDGQQRFTTICLLIQALANTCDDAELKKELQRYLKEQFSNEIRLIPIKSDNEVYLKIMNEEIDEIIHQDNRIYRNYLFFVDQIVKLQPDYHKLLKSMYQLRVIQMELQQEDNAQVIFESINSTGMSLSIADLIRNFLLMNEPYEKQSELFEKYWYKFEQKIGLDELVNFFEYYLNIQASTKSISRKNMYQEFKFLFANASPEEILSELSGYVDAYQYLVNKEKTLTLNDKKMSTRFHEIRDELIDLQNNVANMFLMPTIFDFLNGRIIEADLLIAFELTLSYIFRRSLVGLSTSSLQKVFRALHRQVNDQIPKLEYKDALHYALIINRQNNNSRFPSNDEFYKSLIERNLYGKFRQTNYLLFKLENHNNKTKIDKDNSTITIEHVMPQKLKRYWRNILGPDYKVLHEENVDVLGNLTLTSYNSELGNNDFESKKEGLLKESHIILNQYFRDLEIWDIEAIKKRGRELAKLSLEIWGYPEITEELTEIVQNEKYGTLTLDELVDDYILLKPSEVCIEGIYKVKINSYRDLHDEIITYFYMQDPQKFLRVFVENDNHSRMVKGEKRYTYSVSKELVHDPRLTGTKKIYVDVNQNGASIISKISEIMEEYNCDLDKVEIKYYR